MAFQKTITRSDSGVSANYWRLAGVFIDPVAKLTRLVLAGYVSADIRQKANGQPVDTREFNLTPAQFAALASASAQGVTTFDVIAAACYGHMAAAKRSVPPGAEFNPETRILTIPSTGETILEADIDFDPDDNPRWIPSEFAEAKNV